MSGGVPFRLTVLATHPIQYHAPWYRHIAEQEPAIGLTVLYVTVPTPRQQGVGFGVDLAWEGDLRAGYLSQVLRPPRASDDLSRFSGVDHPGVTRAIVRTRPDAVLVPGWNAAVYVRALLGCRRLGIPTLYRGDTTLLQAPPGGRGRLWRLRSRLLLRLFTAHLAVGRRAEAYLRALGVPDARIFPAPHAVDNAFFAAAAGRASVPASRSAARRDLGLEDDDFVVVVVGKVEPRKRPLDAVRAVATLGRRAVLLVAGAGPLEGACRREAERLGVRVRWLGVQSQAQVAALHGLVDVLVLPSASETWGLAVNEALAAGTPCVVSDRTGCAPDLIASGETGEVSPVGDVQALGAALERVRGWGGQRARVRARCQAQVGRFGYAQATEGVVAACRALGPPRTSGRRPRAREPRVVAECGGMVLFGGLERMTFEALGAVVRRGGRVHCIVNDWSSDRIRDEAGRRGLSVGVGRHRSAVGRHLLRPDRLLEFLRDAFATNRALWRAHRHMAATHVLLPEHNSLLRNLPALLVLRARGSRVVMRMGNAPDPSRRHRILWARVVAPLVDLFVPNCRFIRQELHRTGVRSGKIRVIRNAVFRPSRARAPAVAPGTAIVYVGQVIPQKGLHVLLEALRLLRAGGCAATLRVVGRVDGWEHPAHAGYFQRVQDAGRTPELRDAVEFAGPREDVLDVMRASRVHCCPSLPEQREGAGNVVLEAKAAGIPSVVTPCGGLGELIEHRRDGWVSAGFSAASLAEGLAHFLRDPRRARLAGAAARASLDARFGTGRFERDWWDVFRLRRGGQPT